MTLPATTGTRPVEIELKYRLTDASIGERLLGADELAGFRPVTDAVSVEHADRYLDTSSGALATAGYAGRIRETAEGRVITLKGVHRLAGGDGDAVHRRTELEGPAGLDADPRTWPASDARTLLLELAAGAPLGELVTLRQLRRRRELARDGARVELSLDAVEVVAGNEVVERFGELEVELLEGEEEALEPLDDLLADIEELVPSTRSKLERALEAVRRSTTPSGADGSADGSDVALDAGTSSGPDATPVPATQPAPTAPSRPALPKSPGVLADDRLAEAGRKVLRFHLARMVAREEGTREGADNEDLHAMRVATRRQRAAWRVFGDAFDPGRTRKHRRRLREVAGRLGTVRDLDVLIEALEGYRDRQPRVDRQGLDRLLAGWREQRGIARDVLVRELDGDGYRRWLDGYVTFAQSEGQAALPVSPTEPHRVRDTMPSRIWAAYEGVRAYESVLRWADVPTLHELRIAGKRLRYTIEFVRDALGPEAGAVIERVVALQDHLGWLNDADIASGLARTFLVEHAGDLSEPESAAIGRYLVDRERELNRLRRTVGTPWRGVASLAFRRSLARLIAGL